MAHRILVIDDEPDVRQCLVELLALVPGCNTESASNFAEGCVKALGAPWEIILCDERLPDGRGTDILTRVAAKSPNTRLVLMSAHQDFRMAIQAINSAHVDEFLEKPWEPEVLLERLQRMLQESSSWNAQNQRLRSFRRIGPTGGAAGLWDQRSSTR